MVSVGIDLKIQGQRSKQFNDVNRTRLTDLQTQTLIQKFSKGSDKGKLSSTVSELTLVALALDDGAAHAEKAWTHSTSIRRWSAIRVCRLVRANR